MKSKTEYLCEICNNAYVTEAEAIACEKRGREKVQCEVGDIVTGNAGFGWFDGDPKWISNPEVGTCKPGGVSTYGTKPRHGNCFGACCTYQFYYVVTAIDGDERDPHLARVYVATKAMSGAEGYRGGWTGRNHIRMKVVADPPSEIVVDSTDLIGTKIENLL